MSKDTIYRQDAIDALDCISGVEEVLRSLPSAQLESDKKQLSRLIRAGIIATDTKDVYSCGMRNGMRWCRSLLDDKEPKFEDASQYAQPERKNGNWIPAFNGNFTGGAYWFSCSKCKRIVPEVRNGGWNFRPNCGADMREDGAE